MVLLLLFIGRWARINGGSLRVMFLVVCILARLSSSRPNFVSTNFTDYSYFGDTAWDKP